MPGGWHNFVQDLATELFNNDKWTALRAVYRLGYPECKSDLAIASLRKAVDHNHHRHVSEVAKLSLLRHEGKEVRKFSIPGLAQEDEESLFYPIHEIMATVYNQRGWDIGPIIHVMRYSERFNADSYVANGLRPNVVVKLNGGDIMDIWGETLVGFMEEVKIFATGPEAIECLEALKKYIEIDVDLPS